MRRIVQLLPLMPLLLLLAALMAHILGSEHVASGLADAVYFTAIAAVVVGLLSDPLALRGSGPPRLRPHRGERHVELTPPDNAIVEPSTDSSEAGFKGVRPTA